MIAAKMPAITAIAIETHRETAMEFSYSRASNGLDISRGALCAVGSSPLLSSLSGLRLLVYFSAVSNFMNHDDLFLVKRLVNDAVVSFAVFEKPAKFPFNALV